MVEVEELQQKLADLKRYGETYDKALARMRVTSGPAASTLLSEMNGAEKAYETLFEWFRKQGYTVKWNAERKQYEALPPAAHKHL